MRKPRKPRAQEVSRRDFLKGAGAAFALGSIARRLPAISATPAVRLGEFDYADVRLTGGPFKDHYDRILASYLALDNDRLLKVYRQRAGLPAPGDDMGGWYDADGFVPGHALGQFISGLSRYARATGDADAYAKVRALISGFGETLGPDGYPYASAKAATTWPCYILDKDEIGLLDSFRLAGVAQSRDMLTRVIHGALPSLPDHTYDRGPNSPKQAPYDETYILSENLFDSYEVTGNREFFDLARKYLLTTDYFAPMATGTYPLPGKHAYSHVIALSSAAKAYEVLGDPMYLEAIENAWNLLETQQQYASGGWGPKEAFVEPNKGQLYDSLSTTEDHFETPCGCYAQTKLARYLLRFTGDARYGDGLERILYNTILGAKDPDGENDFFYYSSYGPLSQKSYYKSKVPCCAGTLVQTVADYVLNVYFRGDDGIYVSLYTPSELRWNAGKIPVKLIQTTDYPNDEAVHFRLELPVPTEFAVSFRIPRWISGAAALSVNGKSVSVPANPGTFATIRRLWSTNDTIELRLPFEFRTEAIDNQHPETVAAMRGPLMYVAATPPENLASVALRLPQGLTPLPNAPGLFTYQLPEQTLQFKPFFAIHDERYNTYFLKQEAHA
ncbi:MAG: beta-L-arabinofuranosidase domain-containing protein [Candidatus Acidiferrales bacterium]